MQRRTLLLFILFVVLALFYGIQLKNSAAALEDKQRAQLERMNELG